MIDKSKKELKQISQSLDLTPNELAKLKVYFLFNYPYINVLSFETSKELSHNKLNLLKMFYRPNGLIYKSYFGCFPTLFKFKFKEGTGGILWSLCSMNESTLTSY